MGQDKLSWEDGQRLWAVQKAKEGMPVPEIAAFFNKGVSTVYTWIALEKEHGPDALKRSYSQREGKLDEESWLKIEALVQGSALDYGFDEDFWSLPRIKFLIQKEFGVTYHEGHLSKIMNQRGFSWQVPIRRHPKSNEHDKRTWVHDELPRLEKKSSST